MTITLRPVVKGDTRIKHIELVEEVVEDIIEGDTPKPFVQPVQDNNGG